MTFQAGNCIAQGLMMSCSSGPLTVTVPGRRDLTALGLEWSQRLSAQCSPSIGSFRKYP